MKINFTSPFNKLSYGVCGVNLLKALQAKGLEVSIETIGPVDLESRDVSAYEKALQVPKDVEANTLILWHLWDFPKYKTNKGRHFGWTFFEKDLLNQNEAASLQCLDGVFASAKFYQKILQRYTSKPVYVAVPGVDREIFNSKLNKEVPTFSEFSDDYFRELKFLHVGKAEIRKGLPKIAKCMKEAFKFNDDVSLTLCIDNPFISEQDNIAWRRVFSQEYNFPFKVNFVNRLNTQAEVANLIAQHDVVLCPSLAEGFNLVAIESLVMGKPVVLTEYSAHTEFSDSPNCYLIKGDEREPAYDSCFFFGDGNWLKFGEAQELQFINILKQILQKWRNGIELNTQDDTIKKYTWDNTATQILQQIN